MTTAASQPTVTPFPGSLPLGGLIVSWNGAEKNAPSWTHLDRIISMSNLQSGKLGSLSAVDLADRLLVSSPNNQVQ
jgi:hypothetical protein